jgi:hypothetical protein
MAEALDSGTVSAEASRDATPVSKLALRDAGLALVALTLWGAADTWFAATGLFLAGLVSVLNGIVAGIALASLAHEWGHFAGARFSGGIAPTTKLTSFFPLFHLDMEKSDPAAFRAMSVGGNVAHWLAVIVLMALVPLDGPGRVALVSAVFGFAIFASTTEFPIISRAYSGVEPKACFKGLSGEKLRRNQWIGAAAGLLFAALL